MDIGHTTVDIGINALLLPVVELFGCGVGDPIEARGALQPPLLAIVVRAWVVADPVTRLVNGRHFPSFLIG